MIDTIMLVMEIIGTVSFAISGAIIAASSGLDLFGTVLVGCVTAFGGGMTRDLFLGKTPPLIFSNLTMVILAVIVAVVVFAVAYIKVDRLRNLMLKIDEVNNVFDAIGLAAFTIIGTEVACASGYEQRAVFVIAMGVLTGIGGGIVRDILVDKTPYVLKKHIYALASIFGGTLHYVMRTYTPLHTTGMVLGLLSIVAIRLLAKKYLWKLPKIDVDSIH